MDAGNPVRDALERGDEVFGARVRTFSPTVVQLLGQVGLQYAYIDLEHAGFSPYDSTELRTLTTAATAAGTSLVVRIPAPEPSIVQKVLDAGVRTIIVPRVETAAEVRQTVEAAHYKYDGAPGKRGFGTAACNDWGARPPGYTADEDAQVLVGVMLETVSAVEHAEEIAAVPELGFAKIGRGDLSVSAGCPQEYQDPELQGMITRLEDACRSEGVPLGRGVSSVSDAEDALGDGYQLVDVGGDVESIRSTLRKRLDAVADDGTT